MLKYWEIYQMKGDRYILRQKMVSHARKHGIKDAARVFGCDRNTVRKWLRRYQPGRPSTLSEKSRRPVRSPNKVTSQQEGVVVRLRKQTGFGAKRLCREFNLPCGQQAVSRIIREHGLTKPRKKKHKTKKELRHVKKDWPLFKQLSADTKYLTDIPAYWPYMQTLGLPKFQYTVRDVTSGLCFTGYADEISKSYSCLLAEQVSAHLACHGVELDQVEWQTDNGLEFLSNQEGTGFPDTIRDMGSGHHFIPPKAHTWQSDVETIHRLVEDEFFDIEQFCSTSQFWKKINTYWLYFNLARPNSGKENKTPLQIVIEKNAQAKPQRRVMPQIAAWKPLDLGRLLGEYQTCKRRKGGDDLSPHP